MTAWYEKREQEGQKMAGSIPDPKDASMFTENSQIESGFHIDNSLCCATMVPEMMKGGDGS